MRSAKTTKLKDPKAPLFHESLAPAMNLPAASDFGPSTFRLSKLSFLGLSLLELLGAVLLFGLTLVVAGALVPQPEIVTVVPSTVTLSVPLDASYDQKLAPRARQAAASSRQYSDFQDTSSAATLQPAPGRLQTTAPASLVQTSESGYGHQGSVGSAGR